MSDVLERATREDLRLSDEAAFRKLKSDLEIDDDFDPFSYTPPGPTAAGFLNSTALSVFIMGPLGGGKTTTCVFKRLVAATRAPVAWHPETRQPTRMCQWVVLRDTFRSAERSVLKSWQQWFPKNFPGSTAKGGNDRPFSHTLRFLGEDGVAVEAITEFAGLNDHDIASLFKGTEYSGSWLNELDTHADGSIDDMEQRVGRYPKADSILTPAELRELSDRLGHTVVSGARQRTVIGDMNAPTIDNWTYKAFVTEPKPDRVLFQQPSGRSAEAENLINLEPDYYERIVRNQDDWFVKRMVDNQFGYSRAGKPVHPGFDHTRHVAPRPIPFRPELPLYIGIDASTNALTPAAVLGQVPPPGRIAIIDELAFEHGYGASRFAEALKMRLDERYAGRRQVRVFIDPASLHGGDNEGGQLAALEIFAVVLGLPIEVPFGGSNELALRLGAVDQELRGYLEPNSHFLVSPACTKLIEALAGRYRFKKRSEQASTDYEDAPEKSHPFSDLADATQYLVGGVRGRTAVLRPSSDGKTPQAQRAGSGWGKGWGSRQPGGFDPHRT